MRILLAIILMGFVFNAFATEPTVSKEESLLLTKSALIGRKSPEQAIRLIESENTAKSSAALDYALAVYFLKVDKTEEAERKLESALKKEPIFTRARLSLVRININQMAYSSALTQLNLLVDQEKKAPQKLFNLIGYCHQMQKHYAAAEQAYKMTLVRDANNLTANRGLVQTLIEQDRFKEAKLVVERLLLDDKMNPELWSLLVRITLEDEGNQAALIKLLTAEKLGVQDDTIPVTVASLFFQEKLYRLSARYYIDLLEQSRLTPEKNLEAIKAFLSISDFKIAAKLLQGSLVYNETQKERHSYLYCQLLLGQNKALEASRALKKYIERNPIHIEALITYADLLRGQGDVDEALFLLARVERLQPENRQVYLSLTQCFIDKKEYAQAVQVLQRSLEQHEDQSIRRFKNNLEQFIKDRNQRP